MEDGVPILCSDVVTVEEEAEDFFEDFLGMLKVVNMMRKATVLLFHIQMMALDW